MSYRIIAGKNGYIQASEESLWESCIKDIFTQYKKEFPDCKVEILQEINVTEKFEKEIQEEEEKWERLKADNANY